MKCPSCDVTLAMSDREGVEIDYCPQCRGVWLDRGEIDKLLEAERARSGPVPSGVATAPPTPSATYPPSGYAPAPHGYPAAVAREEGYGDHRRKRKWSDLLDFD